MKLGVTFGSPETTTGGHALKYYASVRLDIRRIGPVKIGEEVCGNRTRVKVVKNKLAPPFQVTEFDIRYGTGIDSLGDLLDKAVEREIIKKSGSYYSYESTSLGQGRERARDTLLNDNNLREKVRQATIKAAPTLARGKPELETESPTESTLEAAAA
jgi:recombination protein RecA